MQADTAALAWERVWAGSGLVRVVMTVLFRRLNPAKRPGWRSAEQRAPARCDGTELDRLDRPARYPHPPHRMSAALGPSPIASVRAR